MIKNISIIAILFLLLNSCAKNDKVTLVESSGRINHLLIVIKNSDWQGEIGDALRDIITTPIIGLPQEEYQFSVNQIPPKAFKKLFKRTRNILFIGYDSIPNFYTNSNVYASPQTTLTILGKNKEDLIENINSHKNELILTFKKNDLKVLQKNITKKHHKLKNIETFNKLGFTLKLPLTYNMVEDNGDFLWYRNEITKGLLNIIAYEIPYTSIKNKFNISDIIKIRDSIGKIYIPGQFDNTYMLTEHQVKPITKEVILSEKKAIETRGLWLIKDDFMGGPFVSYTFDDKKNNRLLIIEGFSYSPATKKRDYVFELEAILKTVLIE
ncbi:MAG: DUF4837 family protein [Flavobacteriaceae bacterium]|nr:DUF4837 family protein [Flavobacteriaceae bacterium]